MEITAVLNSGFYRQLIKPHQDCDHKKKKNRIFLMYYSELGQIKKTYTPLF